MTPDLWVALTIAFEASNQPIEAQIWIAKTIYTRSIERKISPEKVVKQAHQFSCWDNNHQPTQKRKITDDELARAYGAWYASNDVVDRPNLYHDLSVTPSWTKSPKVKFLKQIGRLRFYREDR